MRADKYFADKFGSRTKARDALVRGLVLRGERPLSPSDEVREGEEFTFLTEKPDFVSNGGYKLEKGLDAFGESVEGKVFADLGASTGGFCDCLLKRGAKRVYCVDVGENQLAPELASSNKVVVMDRTNARYLKPDDFPEPLDGVVSDLSFISLRLVLPAVAELLGDRKRALVLFKPQFECGGKGLGKSGILPAKYHAEMLLEFYDFSAALRLSPVDLTVAPIRPKKNREYVLLLEKNGAPMQKYRFADEAKKLSYADF